MYTIISTSGLDINLTLFSDTISKPMTLINKKPIISYILDELYSYSDFVDKIFIVGNRLNEIENFFKFDYKDEFFKTKIICLKNEYSTGFVTDFYSAIEYMVDELNVQNDCEVLLWKGDELVRNTRIFTDFSIGSFQCYNNDRKIDVYKFAKFPHVVNNLLYLKENNELTFDNFSKRYSDWDVISELKNDIEYTKLDNDYDYYVANCNFINNDSHQYHFISVSLNDQSIEFLNKYANVNFTRKNYELCRSIQWDLWSYYDFIDYADNDQKAYLPYPLNRGIDIRGEYCDRIKMKWIPDNSLKYAMLYQTLKPNLWKNVFGKVCYILSNKFHKKENSPAFRIDEPVVNNWIKNLLHNFKCSILPIFKNKNEIYFWMELYDKFEQDLRNYINHDTLFYNGVEDRRVHGDLSLEHIKCNLVNGDIHFVSPLDRNRKIVTPLEDYGSIIVDTYCLYPLFECGKYIDYGKSGIDMPDYIAESAEAISECVLENISFTDLAKEFALFKSLFNYWNIPDENKDAFRTFLNYRVRGILNA